MKKRISLIFIELGEIDVLNGAFVASDKNGVRTHIPVGSIACIVLEPGSGVSRRAGRPRRPRGHLAGMSRRGGRAALHLPPDGGIISAAADQSCFPRQTTEIRNP